MHLKSTYGTNMASEQETNLSEVGTSIENLRADPNSTPGFSKFYSLAFGQVLSVLVAGTGACTTLFQKYSHMNAPTSQNAPTYVLLSLFLVSPFRRGRWISKSPQMTSNLNTDQGLLKQSEDTVKDQWWRYMILSIVDVEANVTVVWAYQYTSITSAMLLDCFTIPSVMILSWIFLEARYTQRHLLGAFLCLCGISLIILSDVLNGASDHSQHPYAWAGDVLCIVSAFLYSVSNVIQEKWVRTSGPPQFLGRLGICGACFSITQAVIFERKALFSDTDWNAKGIGAWVGYTSSLTWAYVLTSWFLVYADAAFFNLSLLTSDVYAVIFSYFVNGTIVPFLYFIAFGFTISGLLIYHRTPPATAPRYSPLVEGEVMASPVTVFQDMRDGLIEHQAEPESEPECDDTSHNSLEDATPTKPSSQL